MQYLGSYAGLVETNHDPEQLGRLKVRVPHVYGAIGGVYGAISTDNLPWALPTGVPNGGSNASGGGSWLPEPGDQVLVRFLDGEPEKPVWEWFVQTTGQAKNFKLHHYAKAANGTVGKPKRSAWTRYGHLIEWNADGLIVTTSKGYRLLFTDASSKGNDGDIILSTQAGNYLKLDDNTDTLTVNVNEDFYLNVGDQFLAICDSISLQTQTSEIELISGSDLNLTVDQDWSAVIGGAIDFECGEDLALTINGNFDITGDANGTITAAELLLLQFETLKFGTEATEPFVKGTQLTAFLEQLLIYLVSHIHGNGNFGSPTTPPLEPPPTLSPDILSTTILGK